MQTLLPHCSHFVDKCLAFTVICKIRLSLGDFVGPTVSVHNVNFQSYSGQAKNDITFIWMDMQQLIDEQKVGEEPYNSQ